MATPAPCCLQALRDATARWPTRNRASDGIMGDTAHLARKSDHNDGNAFDLTHDPAHGVDCDALSRQVINDKRVTYVIWNSQIYHRDRPAQGWVPYTGPNPHNHHMHVSVLATTRNDVSAWPWSGVAAAPNPRLPVSPQPYPGIQLSQGSQGTAVRTLQQQLKDRGKAITVDGVYGAQTSKAVTAFQLEKFLKPDGIVGPKTWAALWMP